MKDVELKDIRIEDYNKLQKYYLMRRPETADSNLLDLYMWTDCYPTQYFCNEKGVMWVAKSEDNKYAHFVSQVTYKHFKELMRKMEAIIGEKGSQYSPEMMLTYFGMSEMTYEEALEEYNQIINQDKVTGGFARLFCDYMGLALGLYPVFLVVIIWMKDRMSNATELIYSRKISSTKLVIFTEHPM